MNDSDEIQRLIRLKRYESPGEEYFQSFMEEFKDRQRAELLHRSARGLLAERISMWFREYNGGRWLLPAGAAAALVAAGFYFAGFGFEKEVAGSKEFADVETSSAVPPAASMNDAAMDGNEAITLQLPRPQQRIPGASANSLSGAPGILPVGSHGTYREL